MALLSYLRHRRLHILAAAAILVAALASVLGAGAADAHNGPGMHGSLSRYGVSVNFSVYRHGWGAIASLSLRTRRATTTPSTSTSSSRSTTGPTPTATSGTGTATARRSRSSCTFPPARARR